MTLSVSLLLGDCLDRMAEMPESSVDAIVTDPPYALTDIGRTMQMVGNRRHSKGFMGKTWDAEVPGIDVWTEALRVLKPAHYLVAFGGTRTHHRLMVALEDAGFEIRDCLMWLYGSGFPKGKGNLKPAWEPVILCRKPGKGVRALGIDECRVGTEATLRTNGRTAIWSGGGMSTDIGGSAAGRWPANLILDEEAGAMLDEQSGERSSGVMKGGQLRSTEGGYMGAFPETATLVDTYGDSGGASRFFYCAKSSRSERNAGCEGMEERTRFVMGDMSGGSPGQPNGYEGTTAANHHPTVKPVSLMRWLVRLISAPGDTVLDPFLGSGTTGVAAHLEGRDYIGIEREPEYVEIARARIARHPFQGVLV